MYGLRIEQRSVSESKELSKDLVNGIYERSQFGKIVVVTSKPARLLSTTRRQWLTTQRKLVSERAKLLRGAKQLHLDAQIKHMDSILFSTKITSGRLDADVTFAPIDDLIRVTPTCKTVYVLEDVPLEKMYQLTAWMHPNNGYVIMYSLS